METETKMDRDGGGGDKSVATMTKGPEESGGGGGDNGWSFRDWLFLILTIAMAVVVALKYL